MQDTNDTNNNKNTSSDTPVVPVVESTSTPVEEAKSAAEVTSTSPAATADATVVETTVTATTPEVATTVETASEPVTGATPATPAAVSAKKQILMQYGIATIVVLIMGAGLAYALEQQGRIETGIFDKISAVVSPEPAAAVVNGTKITKADYDKNLVQLQAAAAAQGADVANAEIQAEIKKQAIDVLVNTELLRQAAYAEGAMVTDDQVEARYQEIVDSLGGVEQLNAKMVELGITEPALRKDIEGEILIQGHLSKAVDTSKISISDDELNAAYAQISSTATEGVTVPPLAEIKEQLSAQLKTNKEQELVNAYITKIREGAEIEVMI